MTALVTIVIVTFLAGYIIRLRQENKRLEEINGLLVQINETQRQKQTLIESAVSEPVLFKAFERAMVDMSKLVQKLTRYKIVRYNSKPDGISLIGLEDRKTGRRFEVNLPSDQAPTNMFALPSQK